MKEYFSYLNGKLIDSNGFYSSYGVTATTKRDAERLQRKAKAYYFGKMAKWKDCGYCWIKTNSN